MLADGLKLMSENLVLLQIVVKGEKMWICV